MEKFKFKYKRKGDKNNKPDIELQFMNGTKGDYAFEVMSMITALMSVIYNNCKDTYKIVKCYMLDENSPMYDEKIMKGLIQSIMTKKTHGGDHHDEV